MKIYKKIALAIFVSFTSVLIPLVINYQNISTNNKMLNYLSTDQVNLNYYTYRLNYIIKKNQTEVFQAVLLKDLKRASLNKNHFQEINNSIEQLERFQKEHTKLPKSFSQTLSTLQKRVVAYNIVEKSLFEALESQDNEDIEDAIIGFNDITATFSKDTQRLIDQVNHQLSASISKIKASNNNSRDSLILSFLIALFLIGFAIIKYSKLTIILKRQLSRAEKAELNLEYAQRQLLKYNDDLEDEIIKKSAEIHEKIYTNFLSGLPNRNKLLEDIQDKEIAQLAIINIDKFQSFNDVYGEEMGNIALELSADFLKEISLQKELVIYHISGDEFVLVGKEDVKTEHEFEEATKDILAAFRVNEFTYEEKKFSFHMSAGLAFGFSKKLLAYADMALKDAKKKNIQLTVYDDDNTLETTHKANIECAKKLKYAIENNKILSYFQPIVPIQKDSSLPSKYESLVRLEYLGKIIPPFNFINVAKSNRLYYKITHAVIDNTLSAISKYKISSSLNFSLTDIANEKTMKYFFDILESYAYNELLTVELLETEDFQNYDDVYDFCVKVRSYGVKIALDDFGAGYSNFSHILHLPVDYIKIDASLISNIDRDQNSRIMVETIVELAHKIQVLTIAEFVSSGTILQVVKELGVDYAQGYYLGKPAPIEEQIESKV